MSKASVAQEPSMDEILASIRRIIETGDEKTNGANREAAVGAARQIPAFLAGAPMQDVGDHRPETASEPLVPLRFPVQSEPSPAAHASPIGDDDMLTAELETELAATWERIETRHEREHEQAPVSPPQGDRFSSAGNEAMSNEPDSRPFVGHAETFPTPVDADVSGAAAAPAHHAASYEAPMDRSAFEPANTDARRPDEAAAPVGRFGDVPPPLVSPATGHLVGASFNELAEAIRQGELRSLEAMAQDMLQPMLRDWLDDNLPKMVERLIREEIERLARGGIKR